MSLSFHQNVSLSSVYASPILFQEAYQSKNSSVSRLSDRLVQHQDGSLEVIPKNVAEVFGERVVRPALDLSIHACQRGYNLVKQGINFLDTRLSKIINFLPAAKAQEITIPTLGILLNRWLDGINQAIDRAKNAGLFLEMEAGAQLRQTIENLKSAYIESLDYTVDRVDLVLKSRIDQLKVLVDNFNQGNSQNLQNLALSTQQILNSLDISDDIPQVTKARPRFVIKPANANDPVKFDFHGNFKYAAHPNYIPVLSFNGQNFTSSQTHTQYLEFNIPFHSIFSDQNPLSFSEGYLVIPFPNYNTGVSRIFLGRYITGQSEMVFKIAVGAFPPSPGSIKLNYETDDTERRTQVKRSNSQMISSCREEGNNDQIDIPIRANPSNGWKVLMGTSREEHSAFGDCGLPTFVSENEGEVVYKGSTIHHGGFSKTPSGRMHVVLVFTEYQDVPVVRHHAADVSLKWGDTHGFNHPVGRWKIQFTAFDGKYNEFVGSDTTSSPYLKVENQGGGFVIKAILPVHL